MKEYAIETFDLTKIFEIKKKQKSGISKLFSSTKTTLIKAVDHLSLRVEYGEIFGLLGPNGAGKTTTIRLLSSLLLPDEGGARVNGYDVVKEDEKVRESIGLLMMGERSLYWKLKGRENLEYFAAMYHIPPSIARERINYLLKLVDLQERASDYVEHYSSGMKQRLAIARCLLHDPPILLLDEPTLGLDPRAARDIRAFVQKLKEEGKTIILTTHYMEEADQLCDRVAIIDNGKIIALDTPRHLKRTIQEEDILEIEVSGYGDALIDRLGQVSGVKKAAFYSENQVAATSILRIHTLNSTKVLPSILAVLDKNGIKVNRISVSEPTLEDVFISLTGRVLRG